MKRKKKAKKSWVMWAIIENGRLTYMSENESAAKTLITKAMYGKFIYEVKKVRVTEI